MFDLAALKTAVSEHGRVTRVVIAQVAGSSPREVGAAMLVWDEDDGVGQSGTIGGGALEYEAAQQAFARQGLTHHALGPELGQCCGGVVTLLSELYDARAVSALDSQKVIARGKGTMPLAVKRVLDLARARGERPEPQLVKGWFIEPVAEVQTDLWIWGAGHVGRALVDVLAPLPGMAITWVDTGAERFPARLPSDVTALPVAEPALLAARAPTDAHHLILTYSHELDLALCHALLGRGFRFAGLIGSDTKWARFRSRLKGLGHSDAQIGRICCPIGQKILGKHPQAIAVGVAAQLLETRIAGGMTEWQTHSLPSRA